MIGITEQGDAALNHGWVRWVEAGKPAVLITKTPLALVASLRETMNVIVHCSITGQGGTVIEPQSPSPDKALLGLQRLVALIGVERVVLRVDPIFCTEKALKKALAIIETVHAAYPSMRVRVSFLDLYPHVKVRLTNAGLPMPQESFHAPLAWRRDALARINAIVTAEVCGEPGIVSTGCISAIDAAIFGVTLNGTTGSQRKDCSCAAEKVELLNERRPCVHACLYCYWK